MPHLFPKKLKNNPYTLIDNVKALRRKPGAWGTAVQLFPPMPKPLRSADPIEVGAFGGASILTPKAKRDQKALKKAQYYTKPREIVYPEDSIRQEFYKRHPFELDRPVALNTSPLENSVNMPEDGSLSGER